jgi:hypothetical protein
MIYDRPELIIMSLDWTTGIQGTSKPGFYLEAAGPPGDPAHSVTVTAYEADE